MLMSYLVCSSSVWFQMQLSQNHRRWKDVGIIECNPPKSSRLHRKTSRQVLNISRGDHKHAVLISGQYGIPYVQQCLHLFSTAAPITFVKALHSLELQEGGTAHLCCEVSRPDVPVQWKKGTSVIHSSQKCSMKQDGNVHTLVIHNLDCGDSGEYSCHTADGKTTARLEVKGMISFLLSSSETAAEGVHCALWSILVWI